MVGSDGRPGNTFLPRGQRINCGGPNNGVLDIEIWEGGDFNVENRRSLSSRREIDGQRKGHLGAATSGGLGCVWVVLSVN
jgi:hypothetical protein